MTKLLVYGLAALLVGAHAAVMAAAPADPSATAAEAQLRRVLASVLEGRLNAALDEVDGLIGRYPNFRLAHLVRGDLMLARAQPTSRSSRDALKRRLTGWDSRAGLTTR